jgi:hypothetical protein
MQTPWKTLGTKILSIHLNFFWLSANHHLRFYIEQF